MFCKEGGIQSQPGEFCWNGTTIGRWKQLTNDGNMKKNNTIRNNREYPTGTKRMGIYIILIYFRRICTFEAFICGNCRGIGQ